MLIFVKIIGLLYTGKSCFDVILVSGRNRVACPPARIIPFIV